MPSTILNIAFDATDNYALAQWWAQVVGHPVDPECVDGEEEAWIAVPGGPTLFFNRVPEPKTVKNRLHLCLRPDVAREQEVDRLLAAGAGLVDDRRQPDGTGWAVLADPEGNEFCVLRSAAERA
ncbi:putative enzyme related to lactoylglutathione lyase [Actinokineospora baliensis]|uniref:VOC family protein n=1 Tax=Actinokineospora baliensis TaxID=547056 RepID=UPI00195840D7|nr:VOC family protein [Actinokineospora baliensis]MBM7772588.1 putative enzyme related to lactoylglutathione lyase [Actinokineospora baliensis]